MRIGDDGESNSLEPMEIPAVVTSRHLHCYRPWMAHESRVVEGWRNRVKLWSEQVTETVPVPLEKSSAVANVAVVPAVAVVLLYPQ